MRTSKKNLIYQFKVTLDGISPPIWRRIQVPARYSFWDLHVALQDAMGWFDCHLHRFNLAKLYDRRKVELGFGLKIIKLYPDGKFLSVIISLSQARPHFMNTTLVRDGATKFFWKVS